MGVWPSDPAGPKTSRGAEGGQRPGRRRHGRRQRAEQSRLACRLAVPAAGEVRIKIVASGICRADLFFQLGGNGPDAFPCILGHEGAGIVESIGQGVTSVSPGFYRI